MKLVYAGFWGGSTCLSIQNLLHAITIFDKKSNVIFWLTISSIIMCQLEATLVLALTLNLMDPSFTYTFLVLANIAWFLIIQMVTLLYILRIRSLGEYMNFDKYLRFIPWIVAAVQLPSMVINLLHPSYFDVSKEAKYNYFVISRSLYTCVITIIEVVLYLLLLKKLQFIMEFRQVAVNKLAWHLRVTCIIVIGLEIVLAVVRVLFAIDYSVTPIIYLLRIYIVVQFYGDLLSSIQTSNEDSFMCLNIIQQ